MGSQYRCEHENCPFGFHVPFADNSEQSKKFKAKLGVEPDAPMSDLIYCGCDGLLLEVADTDAPAPSPDERNAKIGGESYGALILCCDLSGSMSMRLEDRNVSRYKAVIHAISLLLRDFAGKTSVNADEKQRYSEVGRSFQFNRLLISIVRFGDKVSLFEIDRPNLPKTPWFTVQMLAQQEQWPIDVTNEHNAGQFVLSSIMKTVEHTLLPLSCVGQSGTSVHLVLEQVRQLALSLYQKAMPPVERGLPADFGTIGRIANAPGHDQLWAAIYTDGEASGPLEWTRKSTEELLAAVPQLHRITAFFGKRSEEEKGGALLKKIASPCYIDHGAPQLAYLNSEQALKLRNVLHMATVNDFGICWQCLQNQEFAHDQNKP